MEERRKFVRLGVEVEVKWKKLPLAKRRVKKSKTKNISAGGICLLVNKDELAAGDMLSLKVELPTGKVIEATGRVVWIEEFGIIGEIQEERADAGIEFLEINERDRVDIKNYIFSALS